MSKHRRAEISSEELIFNNTFDAVMGFVVLILIPAISILFIIADKDASCRGYTFPIIAICLAGFYDANQRREPDAAKNRKLHFRMCITSIAGFLALILGGGQIAWYHYLPPILLFSSGLIILSEFLQRTTLEIKASRMWNIIEERYLQFTRRTGAQNDADKEEELCLLGKED